MAHLSPSATMNGAGGAPFARPRRGGGGLGDQEAAAAAGPLLPHCCSFCLRPFATLQSLGGHMTSHRREMEELRRQHEAFMAGQHMRLAPAAPPLPPSEAPLPPQPPPPAQQQQRHRSAQPRGIKIVLLEPNHAFWEEYRRTGRAPPLIDFMGIGEAAAETSEETMSDAAAKSSEE